MPASSGGGRSDDERPPIESLRERAGATSSGRWREARSLDEILPEAGDAARAGDMQTTWQAFCLERYDLVRGVLDSGRSSPEIAYQLGEMIHTYFRPRGVTPTGQELRRLVDELLDPNKPRPRLESKATPALPLAPPAEAKKSKGRSKAPASPDSLVSFKGGDPIRPATGLTDEEPAAPMPAVSDSTFEPSPSPLVTMPSRETAGLERLLDRTLELTRPRLAGAADPLPRDEALRAIDAAVDEVLRGERDNPPPPEIRERVVLLALSEVCGLGLIDRLWMDRTVRAVFVNGPKAVFVEREDGVSPATEVFRDQAHLLELVNRVVAKPSGGVAEVQLRDGTSVTVIFPPAAPDGPVLALRRPEPGDATLGRLLAAEVLDHKTAGLLRVALQAKLKILVVGPGGSGKTALLAALARDLDASTRLVTIDRQRAFRWTASSKVELVASQDVTYQVLLSAAERLRPEVLVLDSLQGPEVEGAAGLLARASQAVLVACEASAVSPDLVGTADIAVELDRGRDGTYRVVSLADASGADVFVPNRRQAPAPAFAEKVRAAGYDEALAALLR